MSGAGYSAESERVAEWADARISELMGVINAATAELVSVISAVLESGAWGGGGVRSPEHWVAWRAGVSTTRAKGLVAMARRLGKLPTVAEAFAEGRLSEDTLRLVVARTPPERDGEVAELAQLMTVPQLARTLRSLPRAESPGAEPAAVGGEVSFGHDGGDRFWLRAEGMAAERGAVVARALEAARNAELRARRPEGTDGSATAVTWADALERMAVAALDALDPATNQGRSPSERYQVLVHVRAGDLLAANVHLGPALSASARRRITCDAALRWVLEEEGRPVSWGRRRRSVDPVLRRLVEDRDRGCRVPGCTQVRWVEVHHLRHVEDGGDTVPENLAVLCPRQHDEHPRGLLGIAGDPTTPDGLVFTDRWGGSVHRPPPTPPDRPLPDAAHRWHAPSGEPFDGRWFIWADVA